MCVCLWGWVGGGHEFMSGKGHSSSYQDVAIITSGLKRCGLWKQVEAAGLLLVSPG